MSQQTSISNLTPSDAASDIGRTDFIIRSIMSGLRTAIPVKVISCSNVGGVSPIGYLTVQPMVSSLNGAGQAIPHGQIQNVPYMRIQGGTNAVIIDPVAGDIGIATICDRDISSVKKSKGISAPGSNRKNSMADMVYLMTIIGAAPTQYVQFNSSGITVNSPNAVTINAPNVKIGATGETLQALVTAAFETLYNGHTHASGGTGIPNVPMTSDQLTTTLTGG
jgi:hypothetical protein